MGEESKSDSVINQEGRRVKIGVKEVIIGVISVVIAFPLFIFISKLAFIFIKVIFLGLLAYGVYRMLRKFV